MPKLPRSGGDAVLSSQKTIRLSYSGQLAISRYRGNLLRSKRAYKAFHGVVRFLRRMSHQNQDGAYQKQRPIARIICTAALELSRPLCSLESPDISAEFASLERGGRSRRGGGVSAK